MTPYALPPHPPLPDCLPGFWGEACDKRYCPLDCSGKGSCVNGVCVCQAGLLPPDCATASCPRGCSRNGYCLNGTCFWCASPRRTRPPPHPTPLPRPDFPGHSFRPLLPVVRPALFRCSLLQPARIRGRRLLHRLLPRRLQRPWPLRARRVLLRAGMAGPQLRDCALPGRLLVARRVRPRQVPLPQRIPGRRLRRQHQPRHLPQQVLHARRLHGRRVPVRRGLPRR